MSMKGHKMHYYMYPKETRKNSWLCPNCNIWNKARGVGFKIRICKNCRYKVKVEIELKAATHVAPRITRVETVG